MVVGILDLGLVKLVNKKGFLFIVGFFTFLKKKQLLRTGRDFIDYPVRKMQHCLFPAAAQRTVWA